MITPENVLRHEFIGLDASVSSATNSSLTGITGVIVDETKQMICIKTEKGVKSVPKSGTAFVMRLPDDTLVRVDGKVLMMQPEKRISMRLRYLR